MTATVTYHWGEYNIKNMILRAAVAARSKIRPIYAELAAPYQRANWPVIKVNHG